MSSFTGIGTAFGSFFGGSDLEDRFNEAIAELQKFKQTADVSLAGFRTKGQTLFDMGISQLTKPQYAPDVQSLRNMLVTSVQSGLSPFAKLAMEDANRFLENRAISTGNLRSGAVGLQRAELGRRVVADEFTRAQSILDLLGRQDVGSTQLLLNTGLGYGQAENTALATLGNATSNVAGAMVGLGSVQQQRSAALGAGIGGLADMGAAVGATAYTGGLSGLLNAFAMPPQTTGASSGTTPTVFMREPGGYTMS